ncbi:MAG TPA: amino acid adenylation domain-containing protein, partial [Micromonosporaceae bacterium]
MTTSNIDDRERLIRELLARRGVVSARRDDSISRRTPDTRVPLSPLQEGMWFLDRLDPGNPAYLLSTAARLAGPLDLAALQAAVDRVVARHEALCTAIAAGDGQPTQVVHADCRVPVQVDDVSDRHDPEARAFAIAEEEVETGFDLNRPPLIRIRLIRIAPEDHLLSLNMHHIISDERSLGIILDEILTGYHRIRSGEDGGEPPPVQFPDYVLWHRARVDEAALERQHRFWREQLAGVPALLALPTDRPRPRTQSFAGETIRFRLDAELTSALDRFVDRSECTRFIAVLTALHVLLSRWSGQDDLCVGIPVSTRSTPELQSLVGLMVNSLPIRVRLHGDPTLGEALDRVRRACVDSLEHIDLPLARLVELAGLPRDVGHNPLFQTMCVLNPPGAVRRAGELSARPVGFGRRTSRMDLTLMLFETAPELVGVVDYNTDLFDRATIDRFIDRFKIVLWALTTEPELRLSRLDLRTPSEQEELARWNRTVRDYPPTTGLHESVREQAKATPDRPAVVDGDRTLSYAELVRRAELLARRLGAIGVGPDVPVGLALPAGPAAIVGIVGVLCAGGAYLPLDPGHPPARLLDLLTDAGAPLVITGAADAGRFADFPGRVLVLDDNGLAEPDGSVPAASWQPPACHPDQLAYVIYTSGSTGAPKGVMVSHRTAANLARAFVEVHGLGPDDRLLMLPPLSFDASVGDIFPALISGAALLVHRRPAELTGPELLRFCAEQAVTVIDTAAALWVRWVADLSGTGPLAPIPLRALLVGGEAAPTATARKWAHLTGGRVPIYNHYGPTEGTVCATVHRTVDGTELGLTQLPLGRPLPNVRVHLLDAQLRPVPVGMVGEVYLGGLAPARGYLGAPGLTAQRFVPDPFGPPGARLYRTGDLARHRGDGTLEFLGRTDRQVKIRGYRIDLGEVEAACRALPGIGRAAVVARDDGRGERLVAYLVPAGGATARPGELRASLRGRLPGYLVPAQIVLVPELPLTAHGKLDPAALPAPAPSDEGEREPPRTATERRLAEIWADLLGVDAIGATDNFFDLGGHSLLAGPLAARITAEFRVELPIRALFETTDLAALAALIDEAPRATA